MKVVIADSAAEVGRIAARRIAELCAPLPAPVLGVATGSSPTETYAELARLVAAGELDLSAAEVFALDEYAGLAPDDPHSYADTLRREVTGPLRLDPARVHVPDATADDLDAACEAYERAIATAGGVEVQLLGIGENGHVGFNEPGSSPTSRTHVGTLTRSTRHANARFFDDPEQVPTRCLTQGLGTILRARHLVLVASGEQKADAIAAAVQGPVTDRCPASQLRHHPDLLVVLDPAAAARLAPGPEVVRERPLAVSDILA